MRQIYRSSAIVLFNICIGAVLASLVFTPIAPTPGGGSAPSPRSTPAPLAAPSSSYAFLNTLGGVRPVSYDPCRAIHYVTREDNAPSGGAQLIEEAIATASRASGLVFINAGRGSRALPARTLR